MILEAKVNEQAATITRLETTLKLSSASQTGEGDSNYSPAEKFPAQRDLILSTVQRTVADATHVASPLCQCERSECGSINVSTLHIWGALFYQGREWAPFYPSQAPTPAPTSFPTPTYEPSAHPTISPGAGLRSAVVTNAMPVSSYDGPSLTTICSSGCAYVGSQAPTAASLIDTFSTTGLGFGLHSNSYTFPGYVGVDLTPVYPDGFALNQVIWAVHVRCFGNFEVEGSFEAGTWATDGDPTDMTSQAPEVLQGTWETVATGLVAGGYNIGDAEGTKYTSTFLNNKKYRKYRVKIVGLGTGFAAYGWQWNRV